MTASEARRTNLDKELGKQRLCSLSFAPHLDPFPHRRSLAGPRSARCSLQLLLLQLEEGGELVCGEARVSHGPQIANHVQVRHAEGRIVVVGQAILEARLLHYGRDERVQVDVHGREEVVLYLVVEAAAHPVPPHTAAVPVGRAQHLLDGPVGGGGRDEAVLDVVDDEDVLEVVRAYGQRQQNEQQSARQRKAVQWQQALAPAATPASAAAAAPTAVHSLQSAHCLSHRSRSALCR